MIELRVLASEAVAPTGAGWVVGAIRGSVVGVEVGTTVVGGAEVGVLVAGIVGVERWVAYLAFATAGAAAVACVAADTRHHEPTAITPTAATDTLADHRLPRCVPPHHDPPRRTLQGLGTAARSSCFSGP